MQAPAPPRFYLIPENVRDVVLAYLLTRPMKEVENGVHALRSLSEATLAPATGPTSAAELPARNRSCPCGSGKKYKHCCLSLKGEVPNRLPAQESAAKPRNGEAPNGG